jgi:hypothetical protein
MAEIETVTEVSTPVENVAEDTSANVEPANADTSTAEPETTEVTAETETETQAEPTAEERMYAGKYKSIEELEKGFKALESKLGQPNEYEKKYNELLKQQQEQADRMRAYQLQQANQKGFKTVEDAQIADKVQLAEFQYYWTNLNTLNPEYANEVKSLLENYYQTANRAYLEEAKRYYSSNFIEQVAIATNGIEHNLRTQLEQQKAQQKNKAEEELANTLRADFAEFLGDLKENAGKAKALKAFCGADFITSVEDMKAFENIYSQIAKYEREQAIKEYEAQKAIEETKQKAVIPSNNGEFVLADDKVPSYKDIEKMSQAQFNAAVDKYGLEKILQAK